MNKSLIVKGITLLTLALLVAIVCNSCRNRGADSEKAENQVSGKEMAPVQGQDISIHEAALNGQSGQVTGLLESGIDVNLKDEDGRTALMYSSYNGHTEIIKRLIEKGADVNIQDSYGRTALMMASSGPFPEAVKFLLDHQSDPNLTDKEEHFTALMYAASEGQIENIKILLSYRADPSMKDVDGDDAMTFATNNGHPEVAAFLRSLKK